MQSVNNVISKYQTISAKQAKEFMQEGKDYILLDVRTQQEFAEEHIEGAVLIPHSQLECHAENELKEKDAHIFIYCQSGRRSANAAAILADMGYINIYDIGGILDWSYDTVSE